MQKVTALNVNGRACAPQEYSKSCSLKKPIEGEQNVHIIAVLGFLFQKSNSVVVLVTMDTIFNQPLISISEAWVI